MMKKKSLIFSVFGVLVLLTLMGFGSAVTIDITGVTVPLSQSGGSFTVNITNTTSLETVNFTAIATPDANGKNIVFSLPTFPIIINGTTSILITYTVLTGFVFETGKDYYVTLTATGSSIDTKTLAFAPTIEPTQVSACKVKGNSLLQNNLKLLMDSIKVTKGFGDDTEWYPMDEIEFKVDVENNGNDTIRNIVVEWQLYDETAKRKILGGEESSFSLKEGDDKTLRITFKLDSTKLKSGNKYVLYVWANGKDESLSASTCFSTNNINDGLGNLNVVIDSHFVILDSLEVVGTASCGSSVQVTGEVWNIGDDDEEDVYVKVYSTELGISQRVDVGDIDSFDSKDFLVNLDIPDNAETGKAYDLTFLVYDEDDDIFENDNGDQSQFTLPLQVTGACTNLPPVSVTANLQSSAVAGQELDILATIKNTASTTQTFNLELTGYENWASLVSVDKTAFTLTAGQSQNVLIKLKVNAGVSGEQNFNIVMKQGTKVLTQPVSVSVQGKGFSFTGWISNLGLGGNTYLWVIGALNVLLVLIIIVVAVRVVKKK